jgi:hypothetical protein
MKKLIIFLALFLNTSLLAWSYEKRDLLQRNADLKRVSEALKNPADWVAYPAYTDRAAWDKLSGVYREAQIREGEKYLDYEWKVIKLTDYTEYQKSGSRTIMENPFGSNTSALAALVLAELSEGKGRFMGQIVNGVWMFNEMTTWVLSAHLGSAQSSKMYFPDYREHAIDLTAGDLGSFMSWVYYFFKEPFDKINPLIAQRTKRNIEERILKPYMARDDFWWQAFNLKPGAMVNNWNPWCNFNVLTSFLLIEEDPEKRAAGVYRTMVSTDEFINYTHTDGACEEGPSYWGHAAGKMYDYLQILSYATGGKVSIFNEPIIKNMGEYIANSYVGNGWVVNFADASAKGGGDAGVIFRYGNAVSSDNMKQFAAYMQEKKKEELIRAGRDLFRALEEFRFAPDLQKQKAALPQFKSVWYPQTEFLYMKNDKGFFFAGKGGYNAESHNHNDIGTFSLYLNTTPVFIDAGVGTYTRQTFSNERYTIWTMKSEYHNVPAINGSAQQAGGQYRSRNIQFDEKKSLFSMDLAGAYPEKAKVKNWKRSYEFNKKGDLVVQDDFDLANAVAANQVNFLVWQEPDTSSPGIVKMKVGNQTVSMQYVPELFSVQIEKIKQDDRRLSSIWGEAVYRISLNAKKTDLKGKYKYVISVQ